MADVDNDLEATREKAEKEAREKWEKEPARGKHSGGKVTKGTFGGAESLTEVYVGLGPLAVPCTRGEQKALSGDKIVTVWIDRPEPEDDIEHLFIVPGVPGAKDDKPGMSNAEYLTFQATREARLEKKSRKADKTAVATGSDDKPSSAPSAPTTRPRSA